MNFAIIVGDTVQKYSMLHDLPCGFKGLEHKRRKNSKRPRFPLSATGRPLSAKMKHVIVVKVKPEPILPNERLDLGSR